jgi:hypothetical protein
MPMKPRRTIAIAAVARAFAIAIAIACAGCQLIDSIKDTQEELKWPETFAFSDTPASKTTAKSWAIARREEVSAKSAKLTFVRWYDRLKPDEAHELIIYEDVPATGTPAKKIYALAEAAAVKECPGTQFTMIRNESAEFWFEVKAPRCGATPEYAEIDRYIFGIWDLYRIAYRVNAPAMTPEERAAGTAALESFQLIYG